jgi:hypothetical protein
MKVVDINQYRKQKKSPKASLRARNARLKLDRIHAAMEKTDKKKPWLLPHPGW